MKPQPCYPVTAGHLPQIGRTGPGNRIGVAVEPGCRRGGKELFATFISVDAGNTAARYLVPMSPEATRRLSIIKPLHEKPC